MSIPTLTGNIIQAQNIVINQVPIAHAVMSNGSNGVPIATAPTPVEQGSEMKTGIVVETIPLAEPMPGARLVGVHTVPVQNTSPVKTVQSQPIASQAQTSAGSSNSDYLEILPKQRLMDLVRDIDPNLTLEDEVEELILNYVDEFVDRVLNGARLIATHRQEKTIEVKDVQQFLNRNYSMWAPGMGTDELKPYKRNLTSESHKQRLALIRRALKKY